MTMKKMNIANYKSSLAICLLATPLCTSCYDVEDITGLYEVNRAHVAEVSVQKNGFDNQALVTTSFWNVAKVDHFDLYYGIAHEGGALDTLQAKRLLLTPSTRKGVVQEVSENRIEDLKLGVTYAFQINVVDKAEQSILSETSCYVTPTVKFGQMSLSSISDAGEGKVNATLHFQVKNTFLGTATIGVQMLDGQYAESSSASDFSDATKTLTFSQTGTSIYKVTSLKAEGLEKGHTYYARTFLTLGEQTFYSNTYILPTN